MQLLPRARGGLSPSCIGGALFGILVLALAMSACRTAPEPAVITIRTTNFTDEDVFEVWDERKRLAAFQSPPIVASGTVDSTGVFVATVPLESPGRYWLSARSKGTNYVFLHPGQHLEVTIDGQNWGESLVFSGDFADEQDVFRKVQRAAWDEAPRGLDTLSGEEFSKLALDYERRFRAVVADELEGRDLSPAFRAHIEAWTDARLYFTRNNYEFAQMRAGRQAELPDGLFDRESILLRHRDLIGEMPEIRRLAQIPISDSVAKFIREDPPLDSDMDWQTDYILRRIDEGPDDFRRPHLYASTLVNYVSLAGTSPAVDAAIAAYGDRLRASDRAVLDAVYASFKAMEDLPAPDFEFLLPDSTRMSLADLKGKVVYIDVWATWCGPCLVEMPFSNTLREKYRDRDDLVFLYVSVDDNEEAWYRMLDDRTDFGGLHGITGTGFAGPLTTNYRINGIPRTILVDRDGRLVRVSAPSPSSDDIVPLLDEVLGPGGPAVP